MNNLIVIKSSNPWKCNCVKWARKKEPRMPFGLWTIQDKKKIINTKKAKRGRIAIMNVGLPWGHIGIVTRVNYPEITILEANFKFCKITERKGTKKSLKIIGFFNPEKKKYN